MELSDDSKQTLKGINAFFLEFYKIMCGCFLILFVPQKCGEEICSISDNYNNNLVVNKIGLVSNLGCFMLMLGLYFVEIKREHCCIQDLDIDPDKPNNNLDDEIEVYPKLKHKLIKLNKDYYKLSIFNIISQIGNIGLSSYVIYLNHFGFISLTPLLSYILLVLTKVYNAYFISNSSLKEERMFSAYLTINRTFNTIDTDYIVKHKIKIDPELQLEEEDKSKLEEETEPIISPDEVSVEEKSV